MEKNKCLSWFLKKIGLFLTILGVITLLYSTGIQHNVNICYAEEEYSEEEKAAAKAWLSAHGYPPTRAGAQQAYEDYLNGKFDDDPEVRKRKGLDKKTENSGNGSSGVTEQNVEEAEEATEGNASIEEVLILPSQEELKQTAFQEKLGSKADMLELDEQGQYSLIYSPEEKKTDYTNILMIIFIAIALCSIAFVIRVKMNNNEK